MKSTGFSYNTIKLYAQGGDEEGETMLKFLMMMEEAGSGSGTGTTQAPGWTSYVLLGVMLVAMVLMFILPQRKRKKQQQEMSDALKVGVRITTIGGIIGDIVEIAADNTLVIVTGSGENKTYMRILRNAIYQINSTAAAKGTDTVEVVDEDYTEVVGEAPKTKVVKAEAIREEAKEEAQETPSDETK